ncbi:cysteine hydrolase family protein [Oceanobacillus jeddahense]|uniref:Isochorismatase family protein n=1 Tax=Oceanobacillus jeddahense TaxID=1462527 RepID=A0ABY5JZ18_9BACI|nr:isochorismatase family protein [Oceanobacillus jeddahense]UUI04662.1 isochorismatase family protein [Oceanobacillus jeddahense]
MKAVLAIDMQKALIDEKYNLGQRVNNMETVLEDFSNQNYPVFFMQHTSENREDPFYIGGAGAEIYPPLKKYATEIIQKETPSAFYQTDLLEKCQAYKVDELVIIGLNTEFCCLFTAIAAYDRGFKVVFVEDATATVNNGEVYEMSDLDIPDFIGTVLHWSGSIDVLDMEEYKDWIQA